MHKAKNLIEFSKEKKQEELEKLRWQSLKLFKRIARVVNTSRGKFNMPKRQPCPDCGRWVKRSYKTADGAVYICSCGMRNYVQSPEARRR